MKNSAKGEVRGTQWGVQPSPHISQGQLTEILRALFSPFRMSPWKQAHVFVSFVRRGCSTSIYSMDD